MNYVQAVGRMINDIQTHAKVKCGYASISDVKTKELEDKMESFFLSETLKYAYLTVKAAAIFVLSHMKIGRNA
eukprot:CAMPEP_0115009056 /NCGR_PEP_ID=MMETSP0216-20121206/22351_1 /TAXON_ID=223996 /ORGANISM="Protocruzia adherens, Strain Boccale" /LENGTH=72 /DNA_ID=CAMNT_0002376723 /DNA_START=29 /DNA_END=247 /DNA_ORIENTATION=+